MRTKKITFTFKKKSYLKKFMYYYFENLRPYIEENYGKGSCNKILNTTDFYDMKICILPLEEQKKIVEKINNISKKSLFITYIFTSKIYYCDKPLEPYSIQTFT